MKQKTIEKIENNARQRKTTKIGKYEYYIQWDCMMGKTRIIRRLYSIDNKYSWEWYIVI